jgi:hypothetical protein
MNSFQAEFQRLKVMNLISASVKVYLRGQILWADGSSDWLGPGGLAWYKSIIAGVSRRDVMDMV